MKTKECYRGCGHSEAEHGAFHCGLRDGERDTYENDYVDASMREAYEAGYSVGELNREASK